MNCEKCNRFINESVEEVEEIRIKDKWIEVCSQCFDEDYNEYLKENKRGYYGTKI